MTYCAPCPDCGNKDLSVSSEGLVKIACPKCGKVFTLDLCFPCQPEAILVAWDRMVCRYTDIRVTLMSHATIGQFCETCRFLDDLYPGDDDLFWIPVFDVGNTVSFEVSVPVDVAKTIEAYCRNREWIRYRDWREKE